MASTVNEGTVNEGTVPTDTNGMADTAEHDDASLVRRVDKLEATVTEQATTIGRLATAIAGLLAQQMQPQVQQSILSRLLSPHEKPESPPLA